MSFGDQTVTFNSIQDMLTLLATMEAEIAGSQGTRRSYRVAVTSKGV